MVLGKYLLIIIISKYAVQEEAHCIAHILIVLLFAHGHQLTHKVAIKVGPKCVQNQLLLPVPLVKSSSIILSQCLPVSRIGTIQSLLLVKH